MPPVVELHAETLLHLQGISSKNSRNGCCAAGMLSALERGTQLSPRQYISHAPFAAGHCTKISFISACHANVAILPSILHDRATDDPTVAPRRGLCRLSMALAQD